MVSKRGSSDRNSRWTGVFLRTVLGEVTLGEVLCSYLARVGRR